MSKVLKAVAKVAGVVAIVAGTVAALTGNAALAAVLYKVAAVAGAVSAVAGTAAQMTAKRPPARGSPNLITIGANQPMPIVFGETYIGGNKVHEVGYGGKVGKVENPYKFETIIHSGCGPIQQFTGLYADFAAVALAAGAASGYFAGFLYADQKLGNRPESAALAPYWAGAPDWSASHKLSGYAATGLSLKFDKDGKVFSSGEPQWGVTLKGVKVYDPRLDSTYPGGSGPQRINNRSTWAYSENPGVVGLTYAYGWFHEGKKQGGIGMPVEGIDMARWVEFANVCDANGWKIGGAVYEPGSRWDNLKDICAAGGGEPYFDRHLLGVNYNAPRVSLDTITKDDIADEGFTVSSGRTWRERLNTIAPKFRSADHKWEYVPTADVSVPAYVTDDGEEKREEITWNLVQNKDQAAQLAAYELVNRREIGQIEVSCKPRLMRYSVGDMLTFNLPGTVLDGLDAIIIRPPEINPDTGEVKLTMLGETSDKHDFALGRTTTAPPAPGLLDTPTLDSASATNNGIDALSTASVHLYQRNNTGTLPSAPTVPLTYTFASALLSGGSLSGWTQTVPDSAGGKYLYITTAAAVSATETATIAPTGWSTVRIFAQDGANGTSETSAISAYLTKEVVQLFSYANGNVVSYAPAAGSFKVFSGNADVSSSFSLSTLSNPQALSVSYSSQTYSVTAGFDVNEDTASLTIRATGSGTYVGVTIDKVFSLSKAKGGYEIVATLPTTDLFEGRVVFLTTDDKLYRYTGIAWTAAVPAVDISGTLADAQIAAVAASKVTGQLTNAQLEAIAAAKITGQLTNAQLADIAAAKVTGQLTNAQLADIAAAKITGQLADTQIAAVGAAKLTGQIVGTQITDGAISTAKLAAGSVTAAVIAADTITAGNIAANAITSAEIAAGAVVAGKIAADTVTANEIAANAITASELAAGAVTAGKIAAGSIVSGDIAAGAITAGKIAAGAIVAADIAADTITAANIAANAITASELAAGSVVAGKLAADSVQAGNITAGAVTAGKIAANAITATEIAANAITTDKVSAGAITAAKIGVTELSAITATIGTLRTATTGARTEIRDNLILIYDSSNVLRVRMGIW